MLLGLAAFVALNASAGHAAAVQAHDAISASLTPFAVNIDRAQKQPWPGYGIYLGDGLILTAAHVVGRATLGDPSVHIAGKILQAQFVKEGQFETVDLTLLRIDARELPASLGLRLLPLCETPPVPRQLVIVVTPQASAYSHILPPDQLPKDVRERFGTVIADVAATGNSGSGVFDPARRCLMGIMSRKISSVGEHRVDNARARVSIDIAKYFVPASQIRDFLKLN